MTKTIELIKLCKSYGANRGVSEIDLSVDAGEIFGYLGPNGAGKTTTIRILLDFIRSDRGKARMFGLDSRRFGPELRKRIGYLPGELNLYPHMTVLDCLQFFSGMKGCHDYVYMDELMERLGCPTSKKISSLSHGNKQKVGLIQALMNRPDLLILDEPTNGLDPLIQNTFYQILKEAGFRGQTVFLSSHNLTEVERVCDRVAIIRSGRLVTSEKISSLQRHSLRNVQVRFSRDIAEDEFKEIPNAQTVEWSPRFVRCRVKGDMGEFCSRLSHFSVIDLISEPSSLEDFFLTFYGNEDNDS